MAQFKEESCLLSVIIPVFNGSGYFGTCLSSLVRQTLSDFEVIIVDDGSTDDSGAVAHETLSSTQLSYRILTQSNQGVSAARNKGLEEAKGKYVMFLDSDDYLDADCLLKLTESARTADSDVVFCGCDFVSESGSVLRSYESRYSYLDEPEAGPAVLQRVFTERVLICPGNSIFRGALLADFDISFKKGRVIAEDLEFEFKALFHSRIVSSVPESLFFYVQRASSVTSTVDLGKRFQGMDVLFDVLKYFKSQEQLSNVQTAAVHSLETYMIPLGLAGIFGSLSADGYPLEDLRRIFKERSDYREALGKFENVPNANLASRRKLQIYLLRSAPSVYFLVSWLRGKLRR